MILYQLIIIKLFVSLSVHILSIFHSDQMSLYIDTNIKKKKRGSHKPYEEVNKEKSNNLSTIL